MKFRFCGDLDAPDWILAEVSTLSKMSSVRMTLICRQIIQQLLGNGLSYEKIDKLTTSKRLTFDASDIKAMIAALHFIVANSAKYDVEDDVLMSELMQLGLPKDICTSICRCYSANRAELRKHFRQTSFSLQRLDGVQWRVDYVVASKQAKELDVPSIRMNLKLNNPSRPGQTESQAFDVPLDKFKVMLHELKAARTVMESCKAN